MTVVRQVPAGLPEHRAQEPAGELPVALSARGVTKSFGRGVRPVRRQVGTAWRTGLRGQCRNPALWVLLVVVPSVFVLLAVVVTPDRPISLEVIEGGQDVIRVVSMVDIHGGTMAPIAVASLAALIGLFTVLDARAGDRRLVLAGMRQGRLLLVRFGLAGAATAVATVVSLAVTATVFAPEQWAVYIGAVLLVALVYGLLGMAMAPVFGRVAGVLVAFLLPFLDLGIAQSPMLRGGSASWQQALPGFGGTRVLIDAAVTPGFDAGGPLLVAVSWIAALGLLVTLVVMPAAVARKGLASSASHNLHRHPRLTFTQREQRDGGRIARPAREAAMTAGDVFGRPVSAPAPPLGPVPRGRLRALWSAVVGAVGVVVGLAPHLLHHVGFLVGTALVAGAAGTALFGVVGLLASVPLLLRLRRRFGSWWAPGLALVVFAVMFSVSTLVIGPAISGRGAFGGSSEESPAPGPSPTASVTSSDHNSHHTP